MACMHLVGPAWSQPDCLKEVGCMPHLQYQLELHPPQWVLKI